MSRAADNTLALGLGTAGTWTKRTGSMEETAWQGQLPWSSPSLAGLVFVQWGDPPACGFTTPPPLSPTTQAEAAVRHETTSLGARSSSGRGWVGSLLLAESRAGG